MNTLKCGTTTFKFNSDLSGNVQIAADKGEVVEVIEVPGGDLVTFVADYVRRRRIDELEQAEALEILNLSRPT